MRLLLLLLLLLLLSKWNGLHWLRLWLLRQCASLPEGSHCLLSRLEHKQGQEGMDTEGQEGMT
jgi:hypothetical protein